MAIATKSNIPARVIPASFTLRLDLSAAEATLLRDVLSMVGGSPATTRRRYAETILEALNAANVPRGPRDENIPEYTGDVERHPGTSTGIYFTTYPGVL